MRFVWIGVAALSVTCTAWAQAQDKLQFDVASVRASGDRPAGTVNVGVRMDGSQMHVEALTLRDYIGIAYRIPITRISGPDWVTKQRYDISATIPNGVPASKIPEMMQALLADRFQLKLHHEQKEFAVYALAVGKGPLNIRESESKDDSAGQKGTTTVSGGGSIAGVHVDLDHGASWSFVPNRFEAKKLTMAQLAQNLERFSDRPIVDMTGLKGQYDLAFDIQPEDYRPLLIRSAIAAGEVMSPRALHLLDESSPSALADAVAQTGLRLEQRTAMLDVIVVDDALKAPTEN